VPPPYYKGGNDNDSYRNITSNRVGTEMAKITVEDGPDINKSD